MVSPDSLGRKNMEHLDLQGYRVGSLDTVYYIPGFASESEQKILLQQVNGAPVTKWKSLKNRRLQHWGGLVHEKGLIPQPLPTWLNGFTEKICKATGLFPAPINHVLVNEYLPGQGIMPHQDGPAYFPVVAILSLGSPTVMRFSPHQRMRTEQFYNDLDLPEKSCSQNYADNESKDTNVAPSTQGKKCQLRCDRSLDGSISQSRAAYVNRSTMSVVLMPGSLLIFKDAAYQDYLHGIAEDCKHTLDDTVVNWAACGQHENCLDLEYLECPGGTLRQRDIRISLTCRYVPRVHRGFIKL